MPRRSTTRSRAWRDKRRGAPQARQGRKKKLRPEWPRWRRSSSTWGPRFISTNPPCENRHSRMCLVPGGVVLASPPAWGGGGGGGGWHSQDYRTTPSLTLLHKGGG